MLSTIHHKASPETVGAVLQALAPHLSDLSHVQQLDLLSALSGSGKQQQQQHLPEPMAGRFLSALTRAVASGSPGGLDAAPAELLFALMGAAARWGVSMDQEWVREVEEALVRGLSREGEGKGGAAAGGGASGVTGGGAGAGAERGAPAAVRSVGALRRQLMSDVVLPTVRRGQSFSKVRATRRARTANSRMRHSSNARAL